MENIKIFIASKAAQDSAERMELSAFFLSLNNCYVKKGIYFTPVFLEDMHDNDAADRELADSSLAVFILHGETADADLNETLKATRDKYNQTGKPKIAVYEQERKQGDGGCQENRPPDTPRPPASSGFYSNKFSHIDTLKLGVLMFIKQLELPGVDIKLEDGKAWQGSDALMRLDNVESVAGFEELQHLKQKHAELESRYYTAKGLLAANPDDERASEEFYDAVTKRGAALADIRKMQTQLYTMMQGMYEQTSQGNLSKRQIEGYRLAERGLIHEARDVLDFYAIVDESQRDGEMIDQAKNRARVHVQELMQLKDLSAALLDLDGVDKCYREAMRLEEKHDLQRIASAEYVRYLHVHNMHSKAEEVGEALLQYYNSRKEFEWDECKSMLLANLGAIYFDTGDFTKGIELLSEALTIRRARTDGDRRTIENDIATTHFYLGSVYRRARKYDEALEHLTSALEIWKNLAEQDPDTYLRLVGNSYSNIGRVYTEMGEPGRSAELLLMARDVLLEVAAKNPGIPSDNALGYCCETLGILYTEMNRYEEAEEQLTYVLEIYNKHVDSDPDDFERAIAGVYSNLSETYYNSYRYEKAAESAEASTKLLEGLAKRGLFAFSHSVIFFYIHIGKIYRELKRYAEAEKAVDFAFELNEQFKDNNPYYTENDGKARAVRDSIHALQLPQESTAPVFTPEEQKVALMLTEGLSQREIIRKLGITALELSRRASAIREKVAGMAPYDPVIEAVAKDYELTRREGDILRCLQKNHGNDVIAAELYLAEETVRIHVRNVLRKLGVDSRQNVSVWLENYSVSGGRGACQGDVGVSGGRF